jgi:hypothetical protein
MNPFRDDGRMDMHDVEPRHYPTVIREMLRHENDLTNHRTMWLLIVQGLIANAAVTASREPELKAVIACLGILVSLSAFIILYKSYQARGYLQYLGTRAKLGTLRPQDLPLIGWPPRRVKGWRKHVWISQRIARSSDMMEPFFFLPGLLIIFWLFILLRPSLKISNGMVLLLAFLLTMLLLFTICVIWVRWQSVDEEAFEAASDGGDLLTVSEGRDAGEGTEGT